MTSPKSGEATRERIGFLGWLQNVFNLLTAGIGLVAAIGLPAVWLNLKQFGVPITVAANNDILRAGILPAIGLVLLGLYCAWAGLALRRHGWKAVIAVQGMVAVLPLLVVVYLLLLVALFAYALLIAYWILWPFAWGAKALNWWAPSDRDLLILTAEIIIAICVVSLLAWLTKRWWIDRPGKFWRLLADMTSKKADDEKGRHAGDAPEKAAALTEGETAPEPAVGGGDANPKKKETSPWLIAPFIAVFLLGMLYCIKWAAGLWDPALKSIVSHSVVLLVFMGSALVLGIFAAGAYAMTGAENVPTVVQASRNRRVLIGIAVVSYLVFEFFYSTTLYRRLGVEWGGGRPYPVSLWLDASHETTDIENALRNVSVTELKGVRRVDNLFVLLATEEGLVLVDRDVGPARAMLVPSGRVQAVSWN